MLKGVVLWQQGVLSVFPFSIGIPVAFFFFTHAKDCAYYSMQ